MKITKLILPLALVLCASVVMQARASGIPEVITISLAAMVQKPGTSTATTTNIPAPSVTAHATPELVTRLAQDAFAQGHWPSNSFPKGAVLATLPGIDHVSAAVVLGTNVLVDVTEFFEIQSSDTEVVSGAKNILTGLASPSTKSVYLGTFRFDDSSAGNPNGPLSFSLTGIVTETITDTAPKNGFYSESRSTKMTLGTGEGALNHTPFVCTGSISATGKATLVQ